MSTFGYRTSVLMLLFMILANQDKDNRVFTFAGIVCLVLLVIALVAQVWGLWSNWRASKSATTKTITRN